MKTILIFILLAFSTHLTAFNFNSAVIKKTGSVTKFMPEIDGSGKENGNFGSRISLDGDYLAVGSSESFNNRGVVSIYQKNSDQWELMQTIDSAAYPNVTTMGNDISLNGDYLLIGAASSNSQLVDTGAVLFFKRVGDKWQHMQTVFSQSPRYKGFFGLSVSIKDNMAIISERKGGAGEGSGLFYVYEVINEQLVLQDVITGMDQEGQTGVSFLNSYVDDEFVVLTKIGGSSPSLVRVYQISNGSLGSYMDIDSPVPTFSFGSAVSVEGQQIAIGDQAADWNFGAVYIYQYDGGSWVLEETLIGPTDSKDSGGRFGNAVRLQEDRLLIGSSEEGENPSATGAVYYFKKMNGQWVESQKVTASDPQSSNQFGFQIENQGNELIVSAYRGDGAIANSGAVYQFDLTNDAWVERQKMTPILPVTMKLFGNGLSLNDDWIVIGADGDPEHGHDSGAAYIYKRVAEGVVLESKIFAEQPESDLKFGKKIIIEGDSMLIGAPGSESKDGQVYFYQLDEGSWVYRSKFKAASTSAGDQFGFDFSLDGNLLAVSAPGLLNGKIEGAVFFFENNGLTWQEISQLPFTSVEPISSFGLDISLSSGRLAVGTWLSGKAYVFEEMNGQWGQVHELTQPDLNFPGWFGAFVALSEEHLVVNTIGSSEIFTYHFDDGVLSEASLLNEGESGHRYLDVEGDLLVSTDRDGQNDTKSGANVYQWINGEWQFIHELTLPSSSDRFHNDVIIHENELMVGDIRNEERGDQNGAAYLIQGIGDLIFQNGLD